MKINNDGVQLTSTFQRDFGTIITQFVSHLTQSIESTVISAIANSALQEKCNCQKTSEIGAELLTKSQALEILKISKPTLLRYQKEGLIPYHRVGRKVYFKMSEIVSATKVAPKTKLNRKEARND